MKISEKEKIKQSKTSLFRAVFPELTNHHNTMLGGKALEIMDEIAFITATRFSRNRFVVAGSTVNYKQAISFINNDYDQEEFFKKSLYATRQLAKRQTTWLRSWKDINLFSLNSKDKIKDNIKSLISSL